jgi:hypothetical protein
MQNFTQVFGAPQSEFRRGSKQRELVHLDINSGGNVAAISCLLIRHFGKTHLWYFTVIIQIMEIMMVPIG